jgi:hypothetical protein
MNSLIAFGKAVAGLTHVALGASVNAAKLFKGRKAGVQTVKGLAKMAFESGGNVELSYKGTVFKQELLLKISPSDARQIQEAASEKPQPRIAATARKLLEDRRPLQAEKSPRQLSHELVKLSGGLAESQSLSGLDAIIEAIVEALGPHNPAYVLDIISELEAQGHSDIADMIRAALERIKAKRGTKPSKQI